MTKMPTVFFGHGSPMIALDHNELTEGFADLGRTVLDKFGRPQAILMVSAHWYTRGTWVQSTSRPRQIYDMGGFPPALYEVKYEPDGFPALAPRVIELLGNRANVDDSWGIDHGTWTVLVHAFPKADIPVVQLSVNAEISPQASFEIGRQLSCLVNEFATVTSTRGYRSARAITVSASCRAGAAPRSSRWANCGGIRRS